MAWTTPHTYTVGELVTASTLNANRDNMNVVGALFGAASAETTGGAETTTSTSYAALSTATSVTVTTGTSALVMVSAIVECTGGNPIYVSYAVSGATTSAASDAKAGFSNLTSDETVAFARMHTGLTAGSNTFALQFRVAGGTGQANYRRIIVIPLLV